MSLASFSLSWASGAPALVAGLVDLETRFPHAYVWSHAFLFAGSGVAYVFAPDWLVALGGLVTAVAGLVTAAGAVLVELRKLDVAAIKAQNGQQAGQIAELTRRLDAMPHNPPAGGPGS